MKTSADTRFFAALSEICAQTDSVDNTCRDLIAKAAKTGDPLDMRTARQSFDDLEDRLKDQILAQVHRRMATDISAIWSVLPNAPKSERPN